MVLQLMLLIVEIIRVTDLGLLIERFRTLISLF